MKDTSQLLEALRLAEEGKELTAQHKEEISAARRVITQKLRPKDGSTFQHSLGGYLIGTVFFVEAEHRKREIYGFQCIQWLLPGEPIPSITLWSKDTLSKGGLLYRHAEPGVSDGVDWTTEPSKNPYQVAKWQLYYEIDFAQSLLRRLDELNGLPKTPERQKKKTFIENQLRSYRFKRKIKSFDDEAEKARKNVQKAIKAAITLLIGTPETTHIGLHLLDTIKTGFVCEYTGNWKWKFD